MAKIARLMPLLLLLLLPGCYEIINGNILVVVKIEDKTLTSNDPFEAWRVSKEDHEDWKEHEEDLNHVVDAGFAIEISNTESNVDATAEFYISKDSTLSAEDLHTQSNIAFRVLRGITVPAGEEKRITWRESYRYLEHFKVMKQYVMDGKFWLYAKGVTTPLNISLTKTAVILTLNAKP
jgi:hypothetical protein